MWRGKADHGVGRGGGQARRAPTAYELEAFAELKIQKTDRTFIGAMYVAHWRLVALFDCIVGLAPFRDLSLVLPLYQAGVVLRQLTDYVLDEKARSAPLPYSLVISRKDKPDIDYFRTRDPASMRALVNYDLLCRTVVDPDVLALYSEPDTTWEAWRPHLFACLQSAPIMERQ
jgi:hypothetical protein